MLPETCRPTPISAGLTPETFETADEAFEAGWDIAPYFTLQPLCDFCRSAAVLIHGLDGARSRHADEHANWKKHGRPTRLRELTGGGTELGPELRTFVGKTAPLRTLNPRPLSPGKGCPLRSAIPRHITVNFCQRPT
jgi:hypothetical protein